MLRSSAKLIWKMLLVIRRIISFMLKGSTIVLICLMLLFNAATLTITSIYNAASSLIEATTGLETPRRENARKLSQADERAKKLDTELDSERARNAKLSNRIGDLEVEKARLGTDGPDIKFRGKSQSMRSAVEEVSGSVSRRTKRVAAVNVGSMAGEGIPFWGIAVIVGATALEIHAACENMKDLRELEEAFSIADSSQDEVGEVCGIRVPTADELWENIKTAPGAAWEAAKVNISNLPNPSFSGIWTWFVSQFSWS